MNCYHENGDGILLLAEAVRDAIEPYAHMTGMPIDQREQETGLFWIAMDFDWFNDRSS